MTIEIMEEKIIFCLLARKLKNSINEANKHNPIIIKKIKINDPE